ILQIRCSEQTVVTYVEFYIEGSTSLSLGRAARRLLVDRLPADLHRRWPCICSGRLARHPVLDGCSHSHKGLLHISGVLGTCLHEWDAHLISKRLQDF
ncbi:Os02g0653850, partial [Oryza sativa Japonica Group]